ncbi:MAG: hypothetical protein ABIH26_01365 [Candidatus Eisenbacteria bacterium]
MRNETVAILTALTVLVGAAGGARAEEAGTKPVQLALWNPVQIFDEETSIAGVRVNLLYGVNREMMGLDIGLGNHTRGNTTGFQWGLVGYTEGLFIGWQHNAFNYSAEIRGFQSGFYNGAETATGFQLGFVNITEEMHGLQIGVFNMTRKLHGLQIGVINVVQEKEDLPILPIVNWSF